MRYEGLDFVEALKLLAERVGIALPEDNGAADDELYRKKQKIYLMNKLSARFFFEKLTRSEEGKIALRYFSDRKITPKTMTTYGLGYAPDGYTSLLSHLKENGYTEAEAVEAGLAVERDGRIYDKFRNRVMFPIIDLRGNIIGFGGRIMGQAVTDSGYKLPKYLNSSETPAFNKGSNLFSLNLAKKAQPDKILLVEGYMDVITVYQSGMPNVAATLGTALTENQARLLMKYCSEILLCYDSDEAGQKATIRAIEIINGVGGRASVVKMKGAKDPDEYIKANGAAMFRQAVERAVPSTEYRLLLLRSRYNIDTSEGKIRFIEEATDVLLTVQNEIEVDTYVNRISTETGVGREAILSAYRKKIKKKTKSAAEQKREELERDKPPYSSDEAAVVIPAAYSARLINSEKKLLNLMLKSKKYTDKVMSTFSPEEFSTAVHRKIAEIIYKCREENRTAEPSLILNSFGGSEVGEASAVFYNMETYADDDGVLDELIAGIQTEKIKQQIASETDAKKIAELIQKQKMLGRNV